jgi:two-component sensor histidine kinase
MASIEEFVRDRSPLDGEHIHRLRELIADWQLLSDLSFADLILWVPLRKDFDAAPTGYVAVAHIRPTTAATLFPFDVIGEEIAFGERKYIDQALTSAQIVRDTEPAPLGEFSVKEETIPVFVNGLVVAVISRHRNAELMRQPSRLELNYREIAHNLYRMITEETFPYADAGSLFDPTPRVGDGLIRLDIDGVVSYASPNAQSAFSRLGWMHEVEGNKLGDLAQGLAQQSSEAQEESISGALTGRFLKRVEIENAGGTISFTVLPLTKADVRIGAIVLLNNLTELRRRERELVTKDATIREIHHRVKNNLQTVSALLRLQARRISDPNASAALNEAVRRIASIALVHETLSNTPDASVAFDQVLDTLVTHALELSPRMNELRIERSGVLGSLDPRIATPLALVITELIHNSLEHGLADKGSVLGIHVQTDDSDIQVVIADDGVGLPEEFSLTHSPNLGLQIVRTLTENELGGTLSLISESNQTLATLKFPKAK